MHWTMVMSKYVISLHGNFANAAHELNCRLKLGNGKALLERIRTAKKAATMTAISFCKYKQYHRLYMYIGLSILSSL